MVKLNKCVKSFNTLNGLSNKLYTPNKNYIYIKVSLELIKRINDQYYQQNIYHVNLNFKLMEEKVIIEMKQQ